jgi:hypothetical protein
MSKSNAAAVRVHSLVGHLALDVPPVCEVSIRIDKLANGTTVGKFS